MVQAQKWIPESSNIAAQLATNAVKEPSASEAVDSDMPDESGEPEAGTKSASDQTSSLSESADGAKEAPLERESAQITGKEPDKDGTNEAHANDNPISDPVSGNGAVDIGHDAPAGVVEKSDGTNSLTCVLHIPHMVQSCVSCHGECVMNNSVLMAPF